MTNRYADVAVLNGSPQSGSFTYSVPEELALRRGMAVVVPWRTQWAVGVVLAVTDQSEIAEPRPIQRLLYDEPVLSAQQLELAHWIADYYQATIASCVALFLAPGTPTRPRATTGRISALIPSKPNQSQQLELSITKQGLQRQISDWPASKRSRPADLLEALAQGSLESADAAAMLGDRSALERWLSKTSLATLIDDAVQLAISPVEAQGAAVALRRTVEERRQLMLLQTIADGVVDERVARRSAGAKAADVEALIARGVVARRQEAPPPSGQPQTAPPLTDAQQTAVHEINEAIDAGDGQSFLLHGVTGSGKTEVYLAACERALESGGGVIVLVPEIALAPQTLQRFEARFPGQIAVRHSALSSAEAREQWRQVYAGEKSILIGARSALFGPMPNLRLVILDEEHEWTYKQTDPQPRYHARTVALELARQFGVVTILGSATPDLVTMTQARQGELRLLSLPDRVQSHVEHPRVIPPPTVDVVDMREELLAGSRSVFSRALDAAISETLRRDEQALLFLNRRGMSAMVCRACGEALVCPNCEITLTMHRPGPFLQCHECGDRQPLAQRCPSCGEQRIAAMSFGTAQLESELRRRWGDVPITRWDRDTSSQAGSHEALLRDFADGRSRILIGTQMIAKGLDLPRVTLAAVINADLSLRESDYVASERTFQLLSQVAGRAGRGALGGHVIIQTYSPDHFAIAAAASHDYEAFYQQEMRYRAALDYPPYGRLARLTITRSTESDAEQEARVVAEQLRELRASTPDATAEIIGPAPAFPARRRNQWRHQLLLKGDDPRALLRQLELGRGWSVDIEPVG